MSLHIRHLAAEDHAALAQFIWAHNRRADGMVRCLHAEQGDSAEAHLRELQDLPADTQTFLAADAGGAWLGVIGAEYDADRAWVRGPVWAPDADPALLVPQLLRSLARALPAVPRFDAFWQADETELLAMARQAGWQDRALYHVMEARQADVLATQGMSPRVAAVHDAEAHEQGAAMALHEIAFPATYLPPAALLASLDEDHRLLVATDSGRVTGYLYVQHRRADGDGYIDYLAVDESARGTGVGRALLQAALQWTLVERGVATVSLTVQQHRSPALNLYFGAGFRRVASGAHMVFEP